MTDRFFVTLLTLPALSISTASLADPVADVRCAEIAFSLALQQKDQEAFASMIDEDGRFIGNGFKVTRGRNNIADSWSSLFSADAPDMLWRPQVVSVLESGDLALSRGPYRVRGTLKSGESYEDWGIYNSIWRLGDDGKWTVVFDAGFPATEPLSDASQALIENPAPACSEDP